MTDTPKWLMATFEERDASRERWIARGMPKDIAEHQSYYEFAARVVQASRAGVEDWVLEDVLLLRDFELDDIRRMISDEQAPAERYLAPRRGGALRVLAERLNASVWTNKKYEARKAAYEAAWLEQAA